MERRTMPILAEWARRSESLKSVSTLMNVLVLFPPERPCPCGILIACIYHICLKLWANTRSKWGRTTFPYVSPNYGKLSLCQCSSIKSEEVAWISWRNLFNELMQQCNNACRSLVSLYRWYHKPCHPLMALIVYSTPKVDKRHKNVVNVE